MRAIAVLGVASLISCSPSGRATAPRVLAASPGDSAGWLAVSAPALRLQLQYPVSHVRAVVDEWSQDCRAVPRLPSTPFDSARADTLIIASAPANFDTVAKAMGFDPAPDGYWHRLDTAYGHAWSGVDSMRVGSWRALYALTETAIYFDDMTYEPAPGDSPDARMPPDPVWQARFMAVAPGPRGCSVVLAWRGHVVRQSREGSDAGRWPPELLAAFLTRATVASKPGAAGFRQ